MRLRGVALYVAIAVPFLLVPVVLLPLVPPDTGLAIALIAAIVIGIASTWYVRAKYMASSKPRSVFWGMLVSALEVGVAFGLWVGYVVASTLLARDPTFPLQLPVPPQPLRSLITTVAAIGIFASATYYAVTIYLERRDSFRRREED